MFLCFILPLYEKNEVFPELFTGRFETLYSAKIVFISKTIFLHPVLTKF